MSFLNVEWNRLTLDEPSDQQIQIVLSCYGLDLAEHLLKSIMRLLPWVYPLLFHLGPLSKQVSLPSASNQRLTQYSLYRGCQNPVLKGQNPARFCVLPGRKQLSLRKVKTQLKGLTKWEVTKPGSRYPCKWKLHILLISTGCDSSD